jgi:outer membrane protein OmpA-like peptidoglycan-associated protein
MKRIYKKITLLAAGALMLSSCATIMRKDKVQTVNFAPEQDNTMVFVNGIYKGMSPVSMEVDVTEEYEVTYLKRSYVSENFTLKKGIIPKWLFADLACLPVTAVVPVIVDAATGAWKGIKTNNMPKSMKHWSEMENPSDYLHSLFEIENLYFETGKDIIKVESYENLDKLSAILISYPEVKLAVHGHTDETGTRELNNALSKDRAESVKKYLVGKGVDESRIKTIGHGQDDPLIEGDTENEYQYNRRVEFEYDI